jgi:hypothetical protein
MDAESLRVAAAGPAQSLRRGSELNAVGRAVVNLSRDRKRTELAQAHGTAVREGAATLQLGVVADELPESPFLDQISD